MPLQIDMNKVKLDVLKPWITRKIAEFLKMDDDVVVEFVFNQLEEKVRQFDSFRSCRPVVILYWVPYRSQREGSRVLLVPLSTSETSPEVRNFTDLYNVFTRRSLDVGINSFTDASLLTSCYVCCPRLVMSRKRALDPPGGGGERGAVKQPPSHGTYLSRLSSSFFLVDCTNLVILGQFALSFRVPCCGSGSVKIRIHMFLGLLDPSIIKQK
jgi:hypothetical protein